MSSWRLQNILVEVSQWSCKTTPFGKKQLCSQWVVLVHVTLNDNELLPAPSLFSVFCVFGSILSSKTKVIHCILSSYDVRRKRRLLCSLLHPTAKHPICLQDIVVATAARAQRKWRDNPPTVVGGAIKTDWSLRLFRFLGGLKKSVNGFLSL